MEVEKVNAELQKLNEKMDELEVSIAVTDSCTAEIFSEEEKIDDRLTVLEEEVKSLKSENKELRKNLERILEEYWKSIEKGN